MHHRIVEVDRLGTKLRIENGSLKIETEAGVSTRYRLAEIDCVLLSTPAASLTNGALSGLMEANVQLVVCGRNYQPSGVVLPFGATHLTNLFHCQLGVPVPLRKRLWQSIGACDCCYGASSKYWIVSS